VSSPHFALHHLAEAPAPLRPTSDHRRSTELSTGGALDCQQPVDDSPPAAPGGVWLGAVVPKRHARRAVTRTLLKRQIRCVVARHESLLGAGLWVVRLRAPFDRARFVSAASDELRRAARTELEQLIRRGAEPARSR